MPLENIGVIILDEEHAESYKAENHPEYHAAVVARMRMQISGGTLVLASATPTIEDYMKAQLGKMCIRDRSCTHNNNNEKTGESQILVKNRRMREDLKSLKLLLSL